MIEKPIPKEITEFKEKIVFGLNVRQLVSSAIIMGICIPTYIFTKPHIGDNLASWICILVAAPTAAVGFLGWNIMKTIRFYLSATQRTYKINNFFEELEEMGLKLEKEEERLAKKRKGKKNIDV